MQIDWGGKRIIIRRSRRAFESRIISLNRQAGFLHYLGGGGAKVPPYSTELCGENFLDLPIFELFSVDNHHKKKSKNRQKLVLGPLLSCC